VILRDLANGKTDSKINTQILRYLSRKDLIGVISRKYNGNIPTGTVPMEAENEKLLELIGNEILIISYFTQKWSEENSLEIAEKEAPTSNNKDQKKEQQKTK